MLVAPDYEIARMLLTRGIALVYLVAFASARNQFPALCGERGLLPVPRFLATTSFRRAPSLFWLRYSDRLLRGVCWVGMALAAAILVGGADQVPVWVAMAAWVVLWALYLSIVNVGQTFYAFGWESLLCEAGFYAIFLGNATVAPPLVVLWAYRWLLFRLEFGAGMIKLRGDRCWRDLTCLDYHHETQPLPNPLSWWFHHLPKPLHRVEVAANHFAQLVAPWGLVFPQPMAGAAAVVIIVTQAYLLVSGNYSWLNLLTLIVALGVIPDQWWEAAMGGQVMDVMTAPSWFLAASVAFGLVVISLSWWPARNLFSRRQLMNFSFNRLHLVNAYGAFGSITRERFEISLEGTTADDPGPDTDWQAYGFRAKPGDPQRRPPQVAPYHLRLDWLMWFAALSPSYARGWFDRLVTRLLEADPATLRLLRHDPFSGHPPRWVRARLCRYRFTDREERRSTGAWWHREERGLYLPPVRRDADGRVVAG